MTAHTATPDATSIPRLAKLADRVADMLDGLHAEGVHPVQVAEIALLASLPWFIELTRGATIEAALLALAAKFDGNKIRSQH